MAINNSELMSKYLMRGYEPQRSYNYVVQFLNYTAIPIFEFQVKSVSLPHFAFKKEIQKIGGVFPRTFPTLDSDGLELQLEIEEDNTARVAHFILDMQQRIIDPDGYYTSPIASKIGTIIVRVLDWQHKDVVAYHCRNAYFLKAENIKYGYSNEQSLATYMISFGIDHIDYIFYKEDHSVLPPKSDVAGSPNQLPQGQPSTKAGQLLSTLKQLEGNVKQFGVK